MSIQLTSLVPFPIYLLRAARTQGIKRPEISLVLPCADFLVGHLRGSYKSWRRFQNWFLNCTCPHFLGPGWGRENSLKESNLASPSCSEGTERHLSYCPVHILVMSLDKKFLLPFCQ